MNSGDPAEKLSSASSNPQSSAKPGVPSKSAPPRRAWGEFVPPAMPPEARPAQVIQKPAADVSEYPTPDAIIAAKAAAVAKRLQRIRFFGLLSLAIIALIYAFWATTIGWHNTLYTDSHPSRQSQTAINCYYMLQTGYTVDYQTPVLGPPWRVPFEFPLYQWAVVWAVKALHATLEGSGRSVNLTFFLLTLFPVYVILQAMKIPPAHRLIFLILILVSPFYLFWSRTFMFESTAVFLSMVCLACTMQYGWRRASSTRIFPLGLLLIPAVAFGVLAAMVKITTFFPFGLAIIIFLARDAIHWPLPIKLPRRRIIESVIVLAITVGIPLLSAILWTGHADKVKSLSPIATYLQSANSNTLEWNYGTDRQRFSWDTWSVILGRCGTLTAPEWTLWLGCLAAIVITRRRWKEVSILVFLFVSAPFVFLNLHHEHDYYMYANGIFLIGATGFSIMAIFESQYGLTVGFAAMLITLMAAIAEFNGLYYPLMAKNSTASRDLIEAIDKACDKDSVAVYMGVDWDPTLPYYTQRRALMIPAWSFLTHDDVEKELEAMKGTKIGCIVEVEPIEKSDRAFLLVAMKALGLDTSKELRARRAGE